MRHKKSKKSSENSGGFCCLLISTDPVPISPLPDFVGFLLLPRHHHHPPLELELHVSSSSTSSSSLWAPRAPPAHGHPWVLLLP